MSGIFYLRVLTLEQSVYQGNVCSLVAPGEEGYFGVLARHAPLIATLQCGKLTVRDERGDECVYAISGGFLEVSGNSATLLANVIERAIDIDLTRAEEAKQRAVQRLRSRQEGIDYARAQAALSRALNRIEVCLSQEAG